jgi:hypothetical protein
MLRVAVALAALLAAAALLLPASLRLLLVPLAFLIGTALERYRHDLPQRPPSLRATPAAWGNAVRRSVGWPAALLAALTLASAGAVLLLFGGKETAQRSGAGPVRASAPAAPAPQLRVRDERLGQEFRAHGAAFRVFIASAAAWARDIRRRPVAPGQRWVTIGVRARNLGRRRFDPTRLAYRLRDARGASYIGDFRGGTGPPSLSQRGYLLSGQTARIQLGFRVPAGAGPLTLVFEDSALGDTQVRVALGPLAGR